MVLRSKMSFISVVIYWVCIILICSQNISKINAKHLYSAHQQFPEGSEQISLPNISFLCIYMGYPSYPRIHMKLLLESMRWNPSIQYTLINIQPSTELTPEKIANHPTKLLANAMKVNNFRVEVFSYENLTTRVSLKLHIHIDFNASWYYKLCDFKPTLAYLFPEFVDFDKYDFWAYGDIDVIWGNVTRFAYLFKSHPILQTAWFGVSGTAMFYKNKDWGRRIFLEDPKFVEILQLLCYYNLDELGTANPKCVADNGHHGMTRIHMRYAGGHNLKLRQGLNTQDGLYIELHDSIRWAGSARWFRGTVQIVHASEYYPAGRELMYYHRPSKVVNYPAHTVDRLVEDMITYGYLLPNYIPLLTRYMCKRSGYDYFFTYSLELLGKHQPFADCLDKFKLGSNHSQH